VRFLYIFKIKLDKNKIMLNFVCIMHNTFWLQINFTELHCRDFCVNLTEKYLEQLARSFDTYIFDRNFLLQSKSYNKL